MLIFMKITEIFIQIEVNSLSISKIKLLPGDSGANNSFTVKYSE